MLRATWKSINTCWVGYYSYYKEKKCCIFFMNVCVKFKYCNSINNVRATLKYEERTVGSKVIKFLTQRLLEANITSLFSSEGFNQRFPGRGWVDYNIIQKYNPLWKWMVRTYIEYSLGIIQSWRQDFKNSRRISILWFIESNNSAAEFQCTLKNHST